MPGSVNNPVRFANPFQRIVGVHWRDPSEITHMAISQLLDVDLRFSGGGSVCSGSGSEPPALYATGYQLFARYYYNSGTVVSEGPPYTNLRYLRDGAWDAGDAPEGTVVTGLADLAADEGKIEFGAWEYVAQSSPGVGVLPVVGVWQTSGGSGLGISTPNGAAEFVSGLPVVEVQGQEFTGEAGCYDGTPFQVAEISPAVTSYAQFSPVPGSARITTANHGTFAPIGCALLPASVPGMPGTFVPGVMWTLFAKVVSP